MREITVSAILPPRPSFRSGAVAPVECELEKGLKVFMGKKSKSAPSTRFCTNSTPWSDQPPENLRQIIAIVRQMERSSAWIRNLRD